APDLVSGGHGREEAGLLLDRAELDDGRPEQEDAVLVHPAGGTGLVVLLLEDQPLDQVGALTPVLGRPRHGRPPSGRERSLPRPGPWPGCRPRADLRPWPPSSSWGRWPPSPSGPR